ncbi:hypothetical protein DPMN_092760 [Dreissena polymorpha]|uniref:Uncharacterized protein n=1 Tax=Dreissena polymorpha TaxID=45954 RepID=A0A9D4R0C5_DREPO|nr:hypothetical protein DPMN_092760 [Dreissena polymorpha]
MVIRLEWMFGRPSKRDIRRILGLVVMGSSLSLLATATDAYFVEVAIVIRKSLRS